MMDGNRPDHSQEDSIIKPVDLGESPSPGDPIPWYKTWFLVYFSPSESTYRRLAENPSVSFWKGLLWVVLSALISSFLAIALYFLSDGRLVHDDLIDAGELAFLVPFLSPLGAGIGFWVIVKLLNWIANWQQGDGSIESLSYLVGAIYAPGSMVESTVEALSINPLIILALRMIINLVMFSLIIIGIKTIYRFSWFKASMTLLLPLILVGTLVFSCQFMLNL
jgi:hypothetical protein